MKTSSLKFCYEWHTRTFVLCCNGYTKLQEQMVNSLATQVYTPSSWSPSSPQKQGSWRGTQSASWSSLHHSLTGSGHPSSVSHPDLATTWKVGITFQSDNNLLLFASVTLSRKCQTSFLLWLLKSRPVRYHSCSRSQYEVWMAQVYEEWCQQEQATLNSWGTYLPTCVVHPSRAMGLDGCCGEKERGRDGEEEGAIPVRYQAA